VDKVGICTKEDGEMMDQIQVIGAHNITLIKQVNQWEDFKESNSKIK